MPPAMSNQHPTCTPAELAALRRALDHESLEVRASAAEMLAALGEDLDAAIHVLEDAMHSMDDGERQLASQAMQGAGPRGLATLTAAEDELYCGIGRIF